MTVWGAMAEKGAMTDLNGLLRWVASCNDGIRRASHRFEDCFACVSNDTARNDGIRGGALQ